MAGKSFLCQEAVRLLQIYCKKAGFGERQIAGSPVYTCSSGRHHLYDSDLLSRFSQTPGALTRGISLFQQKHFTDFAVIPRFHSIHIYTAG